MPFKQYSIPKYEPSTGKWMFKIWDQDENLLEQVEHDTEQAALTNHKERFIDDVLNDRVMKEAAANYSADHFE